MVMARTTGGEYVRRKSPETVEERDRTTSLVSRELHVLAVDDSHVDRKVIERLLKISSCRVTAVESAGRALQYLGLDGDKSAVGFDVNLIMTDYSMPGMTGYELLKKIKVSDEFWISGFVVAKIDVVAFFIEQESSTLREIPVVIMSSENILARIDSLALLISSDSATPTILSISKVAFRFGNILLIACIFTRNRCLEEGAEDFLLKPVKLSDVERLKDFVLKGQGEEDGRDKGSCKRMIQHDYMPPPPPPPPPPCDQSSTPIPCPSPPSILPPLKRPRLHNVD
ncbi:hypothetical protein RHSIM_Rhsim08G0167300 [Rhododendron simsii]|uniref:Response regulatory domain-containing protein n=1 Tax=Rhododendron simsii TaxID=118357 RepID=A0A834GI76_RHOSS|nr:hypothetical protein RHSIM_Rhsim08G0167300 [Rhododendron simsii]